MTPEYCPYRRVEDTCPAIARMLAEVGLLTPAPDAPASAGPVIDIPSVPPPEVTRAVLAHRINLWGRPVIDPNLPHLDLADGDERSLRYSLQALWETASNGPSRTFGTGSGVSWWRVKEALREAQSAARSTTVHQEAESRALWWYIALLHLDHARAVWHEHIRRPLQGTGHHRRP